VVDRVDLLMLSVKAPLADAVCATVCLRWREAADLWLDVYREPSYQPLAAQCGLEATLRAGLYDLAQYFHIGLAEAPSLPDFLTEPWRQSLPIRRNRARFYARQINPGQAEGGSQTETRRLTQHLVDLHLYREAIRGIFRRRLYQTNPGAAVPLLAACYSALGEHEALIALRRSRRWYFGGRGGRSMLENAETCLGRASMGPVENVLEFTKSHPAGALLARLLEAPEPVFAKHG